MWILGSSFKELTGFYSLALAIILSFASWSNTPTQALLVLFVMVALESAHTYASIPRYFCLNKESAPTRASLMMMAIVFFISIFSWCFSGVGYFWRALIYLSALHHIIQVIGIYKVSCRLNQFDSKKLMPYVWLLSLLPFIGYHFRSIPNYQPFFADTEIFFIPSSTGLMVVWAILIMLIMSFIYQLKSKPFPVPVLTTIIAPSCLYTFCFLIVENFYLSFLPLFAYHACSYIQLSYQEVKQSFTLSRTKRVLAIALPCIVFGGFEIWFLETWVDILPSKQYSANIPFSLAIAALITPSLVHYYFDGFVWLRSRHLAKP
ncbi:MAG: hypothetical protein CME71_08785 [Halobacteriovorax sp.]|nr:hypothetical protein [Halobacteriovorax sp.]